MADEFLIKDQSVLEHDLYSRVLDLYSVCSLQTRLFVWGRFKIAPFFQIALHVPRSGAVLDIGCGHGIFSNLLALESPARHVTGVDISVKKLVEAAKTIRGRPNISFAIRDANANSAVRDQYSAVTMIDLIHHVPYSNQIDLIQWAYEALEDHGKLVIKDVDTRPRWKLWVSYLHDIIVNRAWGHLYFIGSPSLEGLLHKVGFDVERETLHKLSPYAHVLYECEKRVEARRW